jgi:hypothetical protein
LPKTESRSMRPSMRAAIEALGSLQRRACGDSATPSIRTVAAGADSLDEPINDTGEAAQNLHENPRGNHAGWCGPPRRTARSIGCNRLQGPARRAHADPGRLPVLTVCHVI